MFFVYSQWREGEARPELGMDSSLSRRASFKPWPGRTGKTSPVHLQGRVFQAALQSRSARSAGHGASFLETSTSSSTEGNL